MRNLRDKKGSLSLSIQAIVILVMAMAVLGLGLSFIRGLITSGQEKLEGAIDNAELENPATSDNPITVDNRISVKIGGDAVLKVGAFAKEGNIVDTDLPTLTCSGLTGNQIGVKAAGQLISEGEASGYRIIVEVPKAGTTEAVTEGSYPCTASIGTKLSKQTVLEVRS